MEAVILVDTNAWVHHLRRKDLHLTRFLAQERVHTCDVVVGELLLGSGLPKSFAYDLLALPRLPSPTAVETRQYIERHGKTFAGAGVGWADVQIIVAGAKAGALIHSADRAVRRVCRSLGVSVAS